MKHLANRLLWLVIALAMSLSPSVATTIESIDVMVDVLDNGDAIITETRHMIVDSQGTESYIVVGNLNGSQLEDFSVTDETGTQYEFEGVGWVVDRSRQAKANRCGIVEKSNGLELCWGLGERGERVYTIRYKITSMVRSYSDADGFNWMFVARNIKPSPKQVKVVINFPEVEDVDYENDLLVWGFGFYGDVTKVLNQVVAETDGELTEEGSVIVMTELKKGFLHPTMSGQGSFAAVKEKAFEGSDYEEVRKKTFVEKAGDYFLNFCIIVIFALPIVLVGYYLWYARRERKRATKDLNWYRDIPLDGDLVTANSMYKTYVVRGPSIDHLISAMVLRLLRTKALRIEEHFIDASRLKKMFGGEGKVQPCIVIGDYDQSNKLLAQSSLRQLYNIFRSAAGEDNILQSHELMRWMNNNQNEVMSLVRTIDKSISFKEGRQRMEEVRQVLGLRKFLQEFTLANERHLTELDLWNDYLVYAEMFGIAKQVRKDMEKINPEYLKMDEVCRALTDKRVLPMFTAAALQGTHHVQKSQQRSSGGGGRSSFGGGGGFSGGGSGGGVR